MLRVLATTALYLFCFISSSNAEGEECVELGEVCDDNCNCCPYPKDNQDGDDYAVRCEQRYGRDTSPDKYGRETSPGVVGFQFHMSLRKCYKCLYNGKSCSKGKDCCSQKCENSQCVKSHQPPKPCDKSIVNGATAIMGHTPTNNNYCPCAHISTEQAVMNADAAIDKDNDTDYVNYLSINSGLLLTVSDRVHTPIRKLKICSNQDCPECDPSAYKLEGLQCKSDSDFELIQEGPLSMPSARGECIEVPIIGRQEYSEYKVTFPELRGGFGDCPAGGTCLNYAMKVSEVDLIGNCEHFPINFEGVTILHTNHPKARSGQYFYFDKEVWADKIGPYEQDDKLTVEQWRDGDVIWTGLVIVMDNDNGVHGRIEPKREMKADQWLEGDVIRPLSG